MLRLLAEGPRRPGTADDDPAELAILEWMPDGVVVADAAGKIVFANRSVEKMTGYRRRELIGAPIELLVPEELRSNHRRQVHGYLSGRMAPQPMGRPNLNFRVRRKDGTELAVDIALGPIRTAAGRQVVSVIRDVTERKRLEADLEQQALHDPLTGLANRTLFFDRLQQALMGARREHRKVALVMMDLDGFKAVNDAYGHAVGDEVLADLSGRLSGGLRATDTAARIGGDEFALILPRIAGRDAVERMVRARMRAIHQPFEVGTERLELSVSAGIALYPRDGRDCDTLLRRSDAAMYSAKRENRGLAFYAARSTPRT
jgi:diguanylate cyclase (GGDEF)-like protein/PAS domain S-box-containing protein